MSVITLSRNAEKRAELRVLYSASNSGAAFSRNHHSCYCVVEITSWETGEYAQVQSWPINGRKNQAAAYKAARTFVRENNLRETWLEYL